MPQVVTSDNMVEFISTGKVAPFKAPEPVAPKAPEAKAPEVKPESVARGPDGKFTKPEAGDKTTPAATPSDDDDAGEEGLSEVVRQKINKQHRLRKEAEEFAKSEWRRARAAEERAARLEQQLQAQNSKSRPASEEEAPKEPNQDDFKTVGEYARALAKHWAAQERAAEKAELAREAAERAKEQRDREFGKRVAEAKAKHDDFDDVLSTIKGTDLDSVHNDVTEYIQESEHGPELAYHLAKNPDVLDRLRKLSPRRFIAELGKLEAKWESPTQPAKDPPKTLTEVATATAPTVSRAPAPIAPIDSSGVAPMSKKPEEMNIQELREFRRQEARAAARR